MAEQICGIISGVLFCLWHKVDDVFVLWQRKKLTNSYLWFHTFAIVMVSRWLKPVCELCSTWFKWDISSLVINELELKINMKKICY